MRRAMIITLMRILKAFVILNCLDYFKYFINIFICQMISNNLFYNRFQYK